jgi:hypothetical protein
VPITPTRPGACNEDIPGGVHIVTGMAASITAFGWTQRELVDKPLAVPCAARGVPRRGTPTDYRIEAGHPMAMAAQYPVSGVSDRSSRPRLRG